MNGRNSRARAPRSSVNAKARGRKSIAGLTSVAKASVAPAPVASARLRLENARAVSSSASASKKPRRTSSNSALLATTWCGQTATANPTPNAAPLGNHSSAMKIASKAVAAPRRHWIARAR